MTLLTPEQSRFLAHLRALSILIIVLGHSGLFWLHNPHTQVLHVFVAVFFFMSGALGYVSYARAPSLRDFYRKRLVAMLVPYYLAALIILGVAWLIRPGFAIDSVDKVVLWLTLVPAGSGQLFGQVWFLHTLLIIILASPLLFRLTDALPRTMAYLAIIALCALWPLFYPQPEYRYAWGHNWFQPLMHSMFFVLGILFIRYQGFNRHLVIGGTLGGILFSIALGIGLGLDPNYGKHTAPNLFYMAGCVGAIFLLCWTRRFWITLGDVPGLGQGLVFLNTYTFAFFLLHGIPIDVIDQFGLLDTLKGEGPWYRLAKMGSVLLVSALLAVPFHRLAERISTPLLQRKRAEPVASRP
ncbi:MAG: acyltransferase [Gammaproteobacteria bacterium]|nr:acyltransferase [Gammaproteobacteria bacterium]